ncbi:MAG TPA: sigma-70 family RNA polymerase sigma factor [Beijerinckiaceae bacterium]|nr:sigma-70 family RNA polymerase sigma factor [Beijerinckiaceae bacterium]
MAVAHAVSDEALVRRIADGERLAMQTLFGRHHVRIYRFALRITGDQAAAEDVVSEVFFDVWRQADRFEGRSSVSTWLLGMARFKALSTLRRRPEAPLQEEHAEIADESDDPEAAAQKKDKAAALRRCLARLSPEHREVIDLVYYHERSIHEVAEIVGVPENTVKTRVFYARKQLSELLRQAGIDRGWP